ncbi:hypothetical protein PFISCL1PPCAC_8467, partial [Pristionchus fissidentatus]
RQNGNRFDCALLGAPLIDRMCSAPATVLVKSSVGCPASPDPNTLMVDPCADELFPNNNKLGVESICPYDKDDNGNPIYYIIRMALMTLHRKEFLYCFTFLRFDANLGTWKVYYNRHKWTKKIVAASCAIA